MKPVEKRTVHTAGKATKVKGYEGSRKAKPGTDTKKRQEGLRQMLRERLGKELLYFDGGMGTLLQERGLQPGELPETWNLLHAEEIREIHRK